MKKNYKILLSFIFIVLCGFIFTSNTSAAIKESSKDFTGDVYVIGSTKFDNNTIITATRAAQAGSDEAALRMLTSMGVSRVEINTYYYSELEETWFLVPEEGNKELVELTEKEKQNLEDNLNIYFVNNEEKTLELPYSGDIDSDTLESSGSITGAKVVYKDGKFFIPVSVTDIWFEDSKGEFVNITTTYNEEEESLELGDFYIPIMLNVLNENDERVVSIQLNEDGMINYVEDLLHYSKPYYELYYVDSTGKTVNLETFKSLENTTIKQAWSPIGNLNSTDGAHYDSETRTLMHSGYIYRNENGYYVSVIVEAPYGYDTKNTKINGVKTTFNGGSATINIPITEKGKEIPLVVEWEEGVEITFNVVASEDAIFTLTATYYDALDKELEVEENIIPGNRIYEQEFYPSKEGYIFSGWTTNKETNEKYDFEQVVESDIKLYPIFKTLEEAIEQSNNDNPAVLNSDIVIDETIILDVDADMVLDLNGYAIKAENKNAFRLKGNDSSLTVRNGKFQITGGGAAIAVGASKEDTSNVIRRNLIIESDVNIENETYGLTAFGTSLIDFYGHITITGDGYGIAGNGLKNNEGTVLNIYSGSIIAPNGAAIYQPQTGNTTIRDGIFEANTVIGIKAGNLEILGGTFKSTGELKAPKPNGNGFDLTGDIILAEENASYADHVVINIQGGTFDNSNGGAVVREFNPSLGTENERTVLVYGLYETRKTTDNEYVFVYEDSSLATLEVNGVKYSEKDFKYALEKSEVYNPLKLLSYITLEETALITADKDMLLDLNGYVITANDKNAIRMKGTNSSLTVRNGYFEITGGGAAIAVGASKEDTSNVSKRLLIIEPTVNIISESYGLTAFGTSQIDFYGHITITGDGYGIAGNGLKNNEGTVLNIYSGSITAPNGAAIYQPQLGTATISGGVFEADTVIGIKAGNLNITGGTFRSTGELKTPNPNGNGFDLTGDIILAEENASYADHVVIDITGGTFDNSNGGAVVREFNPSLGTEKERTVTVKGLYPNRVATDNQYIFVYETNN